MAARLYLGFQGLLLAGYGLACLLSPGILADATGMGLESGVAAAEVRAMYGGLQGAFGVLALVGAARDEYRRTGLLALAFAFGGLSIGRAFGVAVEQGVGQYNWLALGYEVASLLVAVALLRGLGRGVPEHAPA